MKQAQQSLFAPAPALKPALRMPRRAPRAALPVLRSRHVPLWLAVHLPGLPLEALLRGQDTNAPQAVFDPAGGTQRICVADARAMQAGILPGMTLAAAWALLPALAIHERDAVRERRLLHRLAARAGRYTPTVCIDRQTLLLEVRGSLQLFNGATGLRESMRRDIAHVGLGCRIALAPTPRAASWLAIAGHETHIDQPGLLSDVLGEMSLSVLGLEERLLDRLHGIGANRVRDLMRLPRDGLARRYSARLLRELDQALGRMADVRRPVPLPKKFSACIDLLHEVDDAGRLLYPLRQLLQDLDGYLRATQQGISRLQVQLLHRDGTFTPVALGFSRTTRDADRIRTLVEQKFETLDLPAPALGIVLQVDEMMSLAGNDRALFAEQRDDDDWQELVERLATRLGAAVVHGVTQQEDHRPERAWRYVVPGVAPDCAGREGRPCWLLEQPQALRMRDGSPWIDGPLQIVDGPERIETGWWSDADITRDYYVARDDSGRRLWVCRDLKSDRWWLQGIFG